MTFWKDAAMNTLCSPGNARCLHHVSLLAVIIMILAGCSAAGINGENKVPQKLYIDATRHFAAEFPGNWTRFIDPGDRVLPEADAVGWEAPDSTDGDSAARMRVVVPHRALDLAAVKARIAENLAGFVTTHSEEITVFDRDGMMMLGHTPRRNYAIVLVGSDQIDYLLIYSAQPSEFDRYRSQFEDMVESFEILP